jgi:hypothetical protein
MDDGFNGFQLVDRGAYRLDFYSSCWGRYSDSYSLVYRQMLANAKGCPECGYKMDISQKRFLLRISAFLGTIIILLIVGLLISTS